jgi:hypothetical protein
MNARFASIAALVACILAGAALAVTLLHGGPRGLAGPAGPQGRTGKAGVSATQSRFGICWIAPVNQTLAGIGAGYAAVAYVSIDQAIYDHGVYTCPQGDTFVSIVPGPVPTLGG